MVTKTHFTAASVQFFRFRKHFEAFLQIFLEKQVLNYPVLFLCQFKQKVFLKFKILPFFVKALNEIDLNELW